MSHPALQGLGMHKLAKAFRVCAPATTRLFSNIRRLDCWAGSSPG